MCKVIIDNWKCITFIINIYNLSRILLIIIINVIYNYIIIIIIINTVCKLSACLDRTNHEHYTTIIIR